MATRNHERAMTLLDELKSIFTGSPKKTVKKKYKKAGRKAKSLGAALRKKTGKKTSRR